MTFNQYENLLKLISKDIENISQDCESDILLKSKADSIYTLTEAMKNICELQTNHSYSFEEVIMTVDENEYIEKLKALSKSGDPEAAHDDADDLLCEVLEKLGYTALVNQFNNLEKWYA